MEGEGNHRYLTMFVLPLPPARLAPLHMHGLKIKVLKRNDVDEIGTAALPSSNCKSTQGLLSKCCCY